MVLFRKLFMILLSITLFRGNIPETLNRVLEPVSVLHLDITDDIVIEPTVKKSQKDQIPLTRHGSIGGEDPGVIGPVVWNIHCKRIHGMHYKYK